MNVEEKERLIKKDIAMIENKVRHAFNQGYEMGVKKSKEQSDDAISRQALINKAISWNKHFTDSERYVSLTDIQNAPSVTPNQRTGRWIPTSGWGYKCSECEGIDDTNLGHFCKWCGAKMEVKECENCKHYGEDLHGANCRFCQDMNLWEVKENG